MNELEPLASPEIVEAIHADDLKAPRSDRTPIIIWLIVALVLSLISPLIYLYFGIIAPHIQASGHLNSIGGQADWTIDTTNWKTLGSTAVSLSRYRRRPSSHRFDRLDLEAIQGLIHVEEVTLQFDKDLVPDDLRLLLHLPALNRLDLLSGDQFFVGTQAYIPALTNDGLAAIAESKTIKNLAIASSYITDDGLDSLSRMTQLESLDLSETSITDEGLSKLKSLVNLRVLSISGTKVTAGAATAFQSSMPSLQHLDKGVPTFRRTP